MEGEKERWRRGQSVHLRVCLALSLGGKLIMLKSRQDLLVLAISNTHTHTHAGAVGFSGS